MIARRKTTCYDAADLCRSEAASRLLRTCGMHVRVCANHKGLSLLHIRHKQRKRRDTRLIACRAQLPLRSCHWKPGSTADLSLTIMTHHHIVRHTTPPTSIGYASQMQPPASVLVLPALRTCVLKATSYSQTTNRSQRVWHQSRTRDLAAKFPVVLACVVVVSISCSANQLGVSKHTCCHPCICEAVGLCPIE